MDVCLKENIHSCSKIIGLRLHRTYDLDNLNIELFCTNMCKVQDSCYQNSSRYLL